MQKKYFEPDLVDEINSLRTNPKKYAELFLFINIFLKKFLMMNIKCF